MKRMRFTLLAALALVVWMAGRVSAQIQPNDAVAICGDSITEQKLYTVFIEDYLLMCRPADKVRVCQFGWSGETAPGFLGRIGSDVLWFKPTVATTCYGMNDGGYSPMNAEKGDRYRNAQRAIVRRFKEGGVRLIIVGSPGCVDFDKFRNSREMADMYNATLASLRDISREVANDEKVTFANVYDAMIQAMPKAKAKYGKDYHVAGGDGFHPSPNGHLIMAYAFLKAMGCDGNIGTITVDAAAGKAQATEGHKVLSSGEGGIEIESVRYPFCFYGNPASPDATRGIIEFFPFNEELNRFRLVVNNAPDRAKVTWGNASKEFTAGQLAQGINLAAEFLDNPFSQAFAKVDQVVRSKQNFETPLHKELMHSMGNFKRLLPDAGETIEALIAAGQKRQRELSDAAAGAVVPVRHTIKVEAVR